MFQVQNQATYSQFQVKTRDELLFELDLLGARQKKKGEKATFNVFYLDEDGRLQDKRSLTFPLEGTVDEALVDFGQNKIQKSGFFKRLFSFKKKEATAAQVGANLATNESSPIESEEEEMSIAELLDATNRVEEERASETTFHDEVPAEEAEMRLESDSHDLDEYEDDDSDSIFDHVPSPSSVEEEQGTSSEEEEAIVSERQLQEQADRELGEEQPSLASHHVDAPILKIVESRDIESLTAFRQKQSFELQLQEEVNQIDELIARLIKQKEGHLKLLHHIQQFIAE